MKRRQLGIMIVCLLFAVAAMSTIATAERSVESGRMRDYPGGPMIGRGIVRVMPDGSLKGKIFIEGSQGQTERWSYNAEAVLIVKTPVEGPFRGTYIGTARRSNSPKMEITIQADFKPIPDSIYLDGHDAFFDITYPEGMISIPGDTWHFYFDGEPFEVPFYTVDQGAFSSYDSKVDGEYFVIRDDVTWTDFWAEHKGAALPLLPKPEIDFGSEMIIVAFHGIYPNNGADVSIQAVHVYCDHWEVDVIRGTGDGILPVVTNPYHIVKTSFSDLPVVFNVEEVELLRHIHTLFHYSIIPSFLNNGVKE